MITMDTNNQFTNTIALPFSVPIAFVPTDEYDDQLDICSILTKKTKESLKVINRKKMILISIFYLLFLMLPFFIIIATCIDITNTMAHEFHFSRMVFWASLKLSMTRSVKTFRVFLKALMVEP